MVSYLPQLSKSVVPPGGYWFNQALADGSYSKISGGSLDHLLGLILTYRQNNGIILAPGTLATPEGVYSDYHGWACAQWPWLCTGAAEPMAPVMEILTSQSGFEMLVLRMQRWIDSLRGGPIGWIDQKRAIDRAHICLGCPSNVDWMTNCSSCNHNLTLSSAAVLGARRTGLEAGLKGCRAYGTFQPLAVWIDSPGGDAKYAAPPQCWRR